MMQMTNTMTMNEKVLETAKHYCNELGYDLMEIKKSPKDGEYLRYVLAYSKEKSQFATWLLNVDTGGLYNGRYFSHINSNYGIDMTQFKAYDDFNSRT
jgi:hypothetical protein